MELHNNHLERPIIPTMSRIPSSFDDQNEYRYAHKRSLGYIFLTAPDNLTSSTNVSRIVKSSR